MSSSLPFCIAFHPCPLVFRSVLLFTRVLQSSVLYCFSPVSSSLPFCIALHPCPPVFLSSLQCFITFVLVQRSSYISVSVYFCSFLTILRCTRLQSSLPCHKTYPVHGLLWSSTVFIILPDFIYLGWTADIDLGTKTSIGLDS